jgi:imidazolonepropionase-like amidohydrolase
MEYLSADDAALLGRSLTLATLLPGASFHRDGRYAPARSLIEAGAAVVLATNFNPRPNSHAEHAGCRPVGLPSHEDDPGGSHFGGHD